MNTLAQCVTLAIFLNLIQGSRTSDKKAFLSTPSGFNKLLFNTSGALQHLNSKHDASSRLKHNYNRNLQSNTALNAEPSDDEGPAGFAGFGQLFNSKFLFSNDTVDQPMEDLAAREVDYHKYKGQNVKKWQQVMAVAASLVALVILYKGLTWLKDVLSHQYHELVTGTSEGRVKQQPAHDAFP